jgi:hypothetical protein
MKSIVTLSIVIGLGFGLAGPTQPRNSFARAVDARARPSEPLIPAPPAESAEVLARLHFVGVQQLAATTNAATFREVWDLPVSVELRNQALDKIARALAASSSARSGTPAGKAAELIRPLLDDLWRSESYLEVKERTNSPLEWSLAIRLNEERRRLWQTNWAQLMSGWKTIGVGWWTMPAQSWFMIGLRDTNDHRILQDIRDHGRPIAAAKDYFLKAEINLPRLAQRLSWTNLPALPSVELTMSGKGDALKSQARLSFSKPMQWPLEKWHIPTNTISDPRNSLISFTALQGIAPWLGRQPLVNDVATKPVPNQLYFWGQSYAPLQVLAALHVRNATNALRNLITQWVPRLNSNLVEVGVGEIAVASNRVQMVWDGLPFPIKPFLRPAPEPADDFVVAGVFPIDQPTNPPPAALISQLTSRTNLLYYDWEITQGRISQLRTLVPMLSLFTTIPQTDTNSLSTRWLDILEPKLGNMVTEVSVASPTELNVVRNSHIGLNGLELLTLAYWIEGTNFPRMNYRITLPPPKVRKKN